MLLGNYLDQLPLLHHHEEEHACLEWDGSFYYLETDHSAPVSSPLRLNPIRVGDVHDHEICGLCQLLPSLLKDHVVVSVLYHEAVSCYVPMGQTTVSVAADAHKPRGPPSIS
jgi:hypothetical protein